MATATDRRPARTKKALRNALVTLLRRKSYDDITVQDIIDAADVGRSTFYVHCTGKEDLLRRGLQMLRAELAVSGDSEERRDVLTFSRRLLEHVAEHRDVYPGLGRSRGRDVLLQELRAVALSMLREDLARGPRNETVPQDFVEQFIVGAFMSVLVSWLEQNSRRSPADVDALFQRLALEGLRLKRSSSRRGRQAV